MKIPSQLNDFLEVFNDLYGSSKPAMEVLHAYCGAEKLDNRPSRRIGF